MAAEQNEDKALSIADEPQLEVAQEEPIEQVMTQETIDTGSAESSEPMVETEDQDRFEETAKFEEEIERKPSISKRKSTRKVTKSNSKSISDLRDKLRRWSDAGKRTDLAIREIHRKINELDKRVSKKHHEVIRKFQAQVKELQKKIDRIERSSKFKNHATSKKTSSKKNRNKNNTRKRSIRGK